MKQKFQEFFSGRYGLHLKSFLKTFGAVLIVILALKIEAGADILSWETVWLPALAGAVRATIKELLGDYKI